ncbi:MAG: hypothetical protein AAFP77_14190 [Bacteroidota bacterium]
MRLLLSALLISIWGLLLAQSPYPIITENCYVKLTGSLLENIDYTDYLKVSYWGLDYRRKPEHEQIDYLKKGEHRTVIDSIFRARIRQLTDQFGEDLICKRLRVPENGFKYYIHNRYGPNPTFAFELKFQLYCEDIQYLNQLSQVFLFKYRLDSTGVFVEEQNISPSADHFARCKQYDVDEVFIRHQARDQLGILDPNKLSVNRLDSVNYRVRKMSRIQNNFTSYRYNIIDASFHNDLPPPPVSPYRIKQKPSDRVSGKFISVETVGAWEIYQFAVDAKYYGEAVDSSVLTVAHLETTHSFRPSRLGQRALVRLRKQDDWLKLTAADSINNFYTLAGSAIDIGYAYPELEKTLYEQYSTRELVILDSTICDEPEKEILNLRFDYPGYHEDGTMSVFLWAFTKHKRRSLSGPLELVLRYDTSLVGSSLASKGKFDIATTYSFHGIGNQQLYNKSFSDSIPIKIIDLSPNQIKVRIGGPYDQSWFNLMPIRKNRVNPNVYGPLFRLDVKMDSICRSASETHFYIETSHLDSTAITYVDYLCNGAQTKYTFQQKRVINRANLRMKHMPYQLSSISKNKFRRGDTITVFGTFLNDPELDIRMRCYGSDGPYKFTRILSVPQEYIINRSCESFSLIIPEEIPLDKSGFPSKMHPVSGVLRATYNSQGIEYIIDQ